MDEVKKKTFRCWRCDRDLEIEIPRSVDQCCGLVYIYAKSGNVESLNVSERSNFLYDRAIPFSVALLVAIVAYVAWSLGDPPQVRDVLFSIALVTFEFCGACFFASAIVKSRASNRVVPLSNNNFAKTLLLASIASAFLTLGIVNRWFPAEVDCHETRFYSTC